ncbi:hypothetical protein OJ252_112 [Cryptosporidium canis]|uniref:Uncharacterized protein n=1 Tax=Cryptosporidium canis TaxID=195482 RepID=A0ABQ8PBY5_9CRYT|nr:hypothetical protein OJ252_112 [Cryptosporidium canis]
MNQVKHRICCNRLERNTSLLFYRNALSFGNGHSIKDTPVQLCYPDVSTTLGFHPHSLNLFQGLNLDFEDEAVLDRPSLIIPTECKEFNQVRTDIYNWGALYVICTTLLFVYILKIFLENQVYSKFTNNIKERKVLFYTSCSLLSLSPIIAVINKCPLFMIIYKALFPSTFFIMFIFFFNEIWDVLFILMLLISRLSISFIQYRMVS